MNSWSALLNLHIYWKTKFETSSTAIFVNHNIMIKYYLDIYSRIWKSDSELLIFWKLQQRRINDSSPVSIHLASSSNTCHLFWKLASSRATTLSHESNRCNRMRLFRAEENGSKSSVFLFLNSFLCYSLFGIWWRYEKVANPFTMILRSIMYSSLFLGA